MGWVRKMMRYVSHKFWIQPIQSFKYFYFKNAKSSNFYWGTFWFFEKIFVIFCLAVTLDSVLEFSLFFSNFSWVWNARQVGCDWRLILQRSCREFGFSFDLGIYSSGLLHLFYYSLLGIWSIYGYPNLVFFVYFNS